MISTLLAGLDDAPNSGIDAASRGVNFNALNPLIIGSNQANAAQFATPAGFINRALLFAFPIAGLILFVMILWGGFEMLAGATSKGKDAGKQRIQAAVIGFFLLFMSYWLAKIIGFVFGINTI